MKAKLFLILTLWIAKSCFSYEVTSKEEKTFKINAGGNIYVTGDEGYIKINSWDKEEVHLTMIKRAWARSKHRAEERLSKIEIEIEQTSNRLNIRQLKFQEDQEFSFWDLFDPDRWKDFNSSVSVDFELNVPREINLYLETDEGDIDVADVNGDLDIETDEGKVSLNDIESVDVNVSIDEGDLDCYNLVSSNGNVYIDTDEGNVRVEKGQIKKIKIECDEGDILLKNITVNYFDLATDEGDIDVDSNLQPNGRYDVDTDEGDVTVFLPQDTNLNVKLEAVEGSIRTDFDLTVTELEDGERARGKIGKGGAKLEVYTDEGSIFLEKQ